MFEEYQEVRSWTTRPSLASLWMDLFPYLSVVSERRSSTFSASKILMWDRISDSLHSKGNDTSVCTAVLLLACRYYLVSGWILWLLIASETQKWGSSGHSCLLRISEHTQNFNIPNWLSKPPVQCRKGRKNSNYAAIPPSHWLIKGHRSGFVLPIRLL